MKMHLHGIIIGTGHYLWPGGSGSKVGGIEIFLRYREWASKINNSAACGVGREKFSSKNVFEPDARLVINNDWSLLSIMYP